MANNIGNPVVILMEPQMGENIGATARSMKNFGLSDLRIVNPRDGWPNSKAREMSKNAADIIEQATIFQSLAESCHDIHNIYAATARPRDMVKPTYSAFDTAAEIIKNKSQNKQSALLFGPERSGLDNESISLATAICSIPVSDDYPSLNLAQAVTVTCYEWFRQQELPDNKTIIQKEEYATKEKVEHLISHLEKQLDATHFFQVADKKPGMMKNIRNIFTRNNLTEQEVQTLRGIIRAISSKK